MKKQLFFTAIAFAGMAQASQPEWYRIDKHIAGLWNSPYSTTVQDAATVVCAIKPECAAKIAADITERIITANGRFNTPNVWDGVDGNSGAKAWYPVAITAGAVTRLMWRWHNVHNCQQNQNTVTKSEFDTIANNWAERHAIVRGNKLAELTTAAGFVKQNDIADMASKSWTTQQFAAKDHNHDN